MDLRDRQALTRELRGLYKRIDDLDRRQAATLMTGRVAEIDGYRVRLQLGDGVAGKPFLSPWVQLQEAAGGTGSHFPVAIGDPMRLLSPNGELGPHSLAIRDGYTEDRPDPANDGEFVLAHGGAAIRMAGGVIQLEGRVKARGDELSHNDRNVGDTHTHPGVQRGGARTNEPS